MNVFTAIGRVGKDAVVRTTNAGKAVAGWSLAVDDGFGEHKQTVWIDCALWGDRAHKLAEYIRKGDWLGVTGQIGTREHEGRTYIKLRVAEVKLLGNKRESNDERPQAQPADEFQDDVPF